ncbi:hypothetical protein [Halobellus rubicundus]|uniref:Uncharacterized protein n=1 Tax=Halobellus rubicundus TaxID=2996466 RepID=A0ABD5M993_9EURY
MTLSFTVDDRFHAAAEEWGEQRLMDTEEALETKVEQALLEIEHLVAGVHEVEFTVDGREVRYEPTDDLAAFLESQAAEAGIDEAAVLKLHVDLFASVFLDDDEERPPNAPPT